MRLRYRSARRVSTGRGLKGRAMAKATTAAAVALMLVYACLGRTAFGSVPQPTEPVPTVHGPVFGLVEDGIAAFKGIRYGAPPIGARRFLPPEPPAPWTNLADATDFGAPAMQMYDRPVAPSLLSRQLATVFTTHSDMKIQNEDSLFLNVWTPGLDEGKRPVMFWIHGGGFAYGSGAWPVYDGANLARRGDVVVVTVNHRLNVFGYLDLESVGGPAWAGSGNAGMLDLVLALTWVRDNIARFGGDPDSVTVMGESGGGSKVSALLAMPGAAGLFHKAIIQSGPGLTGVPRPEAQRNAELLLAELGIRADDLETIRSVSAPAILDAARTAAAKAGGGPFGLRFAPVVDGAVLPRDPFTPDAPAQARDIPVLIGWNKDEWTIFSTTEPWFGTLTEDALPEYARRVVGDRADAVLGAYRRLYPEYSPTYVYNALLGDSRMMAGSIQLAERKAAQGGAPVWMYYLTWETPVAGGVLKSPHTLDIPFMFSNVDRAVALTGDGPGARALETQMAESWIAFARSGDPNNPAVPRWPPYDAEARATLVFDKPPRVVNDPNAELRRLLLSTD
jgi:para-nitrobenzyl esterase